MDVHSPKNGMKRGIDPYPKTHTNILKEDVLDIDIYQWSTADFDAEVDLHWGDIWI